MLSIDDCIALSMLTEDEIAAIAEHEHIPFVAATEMGCYLCHSPDGVPMLKRIILDDIDAATKRGDFHHAAKLRLVMKHFIETHPDRPADRKED